LLAGVDILALFQNSTRNRATTNTGGEARLDLHARLDCAQSPEGAAVDATAAS